MLQKNPPIQLQSDPRMDPPIGPRTDPLFDAPIDHPIDSSSGLRLIPLDIPFKIELTVELLFESILQLTLPSNRIDVPINFPIFRLTSLLNTQLIPMDKPIEPRIDSSIGSPWALSSNTRIDSHIDGPNGPNRQCCTGLIPK